MQKYHTKFSLQKLEQERNSTYTKVTMLNLELFKLKVTILLRIIKLGR